MRPVDADSKLASSAMAPRDPALAERKTPRRQSRSALTQAAILSAASHEFSEKGFDGARVDEIALLSGAQKNLIYYYFESKDGLFAAVLDRMYETLRARQADLLIRDMEPVDGMRKLVRATAKVWLQHPEFLNILSAENMLRGRHIKQSRNLQAMYNPLLETIEILLQRGVALGLFRKNIDVIDLYISITGLSAYYLDRRYTLSAIFGDRLMSARRIKQRVDHSVEMILRYLAV